MSIMFDNLRKNPIMQEVPMSETPFSYGLSEGAPYLFFKGEDWQDLMGHEIKYYSSGVLLKMKDKHKEHNNEDSFIFFNNNGEKVFEISNIKYNGYSNRNKPNTVINIIIRERVLHVTVLDLNTNKTDEYFVSIKHKNKIYDVFENKNESEISL